MIRLDIKNFGICREVHLHDDAPMSLIIGRNESGKSTLIGAAKLAMTKSAFGLRGADLNELVSHGSTGGFHIRLAIDGINVSQTLGGGDAIKGIAERLGVPADVLPLMFDSDLCGDGGNKAMRAFLDGVASSSFDALAHFAADPVMVDCINMARRSGKITTKQIIQYCESMRALQKSPPLPVMPTIPNPSAAEIAKLEAALAAASATLAGEVATKKECIDSGSLMLRLTQYIKELETFERLSAASTINDVLGDRRAKYEAVAGINIKTIEAVSHLLHPLAMESLFDAKLHGPIFVVADQAVVKARDAIADAIKSASDMLKANPPPASAPERPTLTHEDQLVYDDLKKDGLLGPASIQALSLAAATETSLAEGRRAAAQATVTSLTNAKTAAIQHQGAWRAYETALLEYDSAKAKSESDWKKWDDAGKMIAAAENDHINKSGDAFGTMVSEFSAYVLQGRKLKINRDTGISLGEVPIARCSVSTQWRMEITTMAAIARMLKSPLLLIDAADILDDYNKARMQDFLLERIVPHFKHVILTSTYHGKLEDQRPSTDPRATKWLIKDGELSRLALPVSG